MLAQSEADLLIAMRKAFVNPQVISLFPGDSQTHELIGDDNRERFVLDLERGTIRLSKYKFQTRGRQVIVLVRLDIDGAPHTNPDGDKLGGTHMHIYRETYDDRWAYPLNPAEFSDPSNIANTFGDFCTFCNIPAIPHFQGTLL